jgi:hypothetical protein
MANEAAGTRPSHHPELRQQYEMKLRWIVLAAACTLALAVLIHAAVYLVFRVEESGEAERDADRRLSGVRGEPSLPPSPRLQGVPGLSPSLPREDLEALRAREAERLGSYGPADAGGFVRIPIERAMDLLLEKGIPAVQKEWDGR